MRNQRRNTLTMGSKQQQQQQQQQNFGNILLSQPTSSKQIIGISNQIDSKTGQLIDMVKLRIAYQGKYYEITTTKQHLSLFPPPLQLQQQQQQQFTTPSSPLVFQPPNNTREQLSLPNSFDNYNNRSLFPQQLEVPNFDSITSAPTMDTQIRKDVFGINGLGGQQQQHQHHRISSAPTLTTEIRKEIFNSDDNNNQQQNQQNSSAPTLTTEIRKEIFKSDNNHSQQKQQQNQRNSSAPTLTTEIRKTIFNSDEEYRKQEIDEDDDEVSLNTIARVEKIDSLKSEASNRKVQEMKRQQYVISFEDLEFSEKAKLIGKGSYASVWIARWEFNVYAVKILNFKKMTQSSLEEFISEADIMTKLRHPNLTTLYAVVLDPGKYGLVMEYLQRGSLYKVLHDQNVHLDWTERLNLMMAIGKGILHLHNNKLLHRDLKSLNVLVTDDLKSAKLCDFGLSCLKQSQNNERGPIGTIQWMAPELFKNEEYTEKCDIYSFGVIIWEICTRQRPYSSFQDVNQLIHIVKNGYRDPMTENVPEFLRRLFNDCVKGIAKERPSIRDILIRLEKRN